MLADNRQAWDMDSEGVFTQRRPAKGEAERGTHKNADGVLHEASCVSEADRWI